MISFCICFYPHVVLDCIFPFLQKVVVIVNIFTTTFQSVNEVSLTINSIASSLISVNVPSTIVNWMVEIKLGFFSEVFPKVI